MDQSALSWDHCRSLLSVYRTGSLSAAARALGVTQPTVARHVEQLEQALGGAALFTRSPQGLAPTEAAETLIPHARAMEASAAAMVRAASGPDDALAGTVRITASEVIGIEVLPAMLASLGAVHPQLTFELVATNETADLLRRDADIAVRMVRPSQGALIARKVGDIRLGMFARQDYLARRGTPAAIEDLAGHALIGFDHETTAAQSLRDRGLDIRREVFSFRTDSDAAQLSAIRAGLGIGICQVALARRDPQLVRLFPDTMAFPLETWVTMHGDLRGNQRVRLVFDHLATGLSAYVKAGHSA
ncbi:LysR family transcriptional regulator [Hyphomonas johnsonii]|uniref:LysR family transcriptional regulator n=1 Tax=Hyphomonas johnsonii MHS-2 TaxID=1280950 RepID=A0A059FMW4_9PROT|nr:LysR family transcriptional regulator [Hyphomonas johnsonii]KCZ91818.1 LysR family transcriptional regulator [Hyphomonas johnsonii MHS-2]